jgi:hypothetical protein
MMVSFMEKLLLRAEEVLSDIVFGGFENQPASAMEKLEQIMVSFKELGMNEGYSIVEKLRDELSGFHRKETDGSHLCELACRLEFYLSCVKNSAGI